MTPFNQLTGVLKVYIAAYGTSIPAIGSTTGYTELGATDGEQTIAHEGELEFFFDNDNQSAVKAVRPEEKHTYTFNLVGLSLENYAKVLGGTVTTATDEKKLTLKRGFHPTEYSLILTGNAFSPYGNYAARYVVPRGVFSNDLEITLAKDGRPSMECEFTALEDITGALSVGYLEATFQ